MATEAQNSFLYEDLDWRCKGYPDENGNLPDKNDDNDKEDDDYYKNSGEKQYTPKCKELIDCFDDDSRLGSLSGCISLENNWCAESMDKGSIFYEDKISDDYPRPTEDPLCSSVTEPCREYEFCSTLDSSDRIKGCEDARVNWCKASKNSSTALYEQVKNPCMEVEDDDPRFGLTDACENLADCFGKTNSARRNLCVDNQNYGCAKSSDPESIFYDSVNYDKWPLNFNLPECDDVTIACRQLEYCEVLDNDRDFKNCQAGRANWCSATKSENSFLYEDLDQRCNGKDDDKNGSSNDDSDPTPVNNDTKPNDDSCYVAINGFYFSCSGATPGLKIASSAALVALAAIILQ